MIGGLIAGSKLENTKLPAEVEIEFKDIEIFDKKDKLIKRIDSIHDKKEFITSADGYGQNIYFEVNKHLKFVIDKLLTRIENSIMNIK